MTKRIFLLLGLWVLAGLVHAAPADAKPLIGDAEAGQETAGQCAACHGPKGNMESDQFPKLAGQGAPYIYEQLKLFKSGERENAIMAGQAAGLDDTTMKDVAAYYAAQQTRPGAADETIAPTGARLYHGGDSDKNIPACSGCHGPSGLGNAAAKFPRLSGQNAPYIVAQLTAYREGTRSGYRNAKIMAAVAHRLSDSQIKALASYAAGLSPSGKDTVNDKGALMQKVAGPAAAGGAQAGTDKADNAGDSSESGESADSGSEQTATEADAATAAGEDSSGNTNAASDADTQNGSSNTNASGDDEGAQQSDSNTDGQTEDQAGTNEPAAEESTENNSQQ